MSHPAEVLGHLAKNHTRRVSPKCHSWARISLTLSAPADPSGFGHSPMRSVTGTRRCILNPAIGGRCAPRSSLSPAMLNDGFQIARSCSPCALSGIDRRLCDDLSNGERESCHAGID